MQPAETSSASSPPKARILIVDDETAQMRALCDTLRDAGFATVGLSNGPAALDALREAEFDLLVTDLMMPGMDGITLLRAALALRPNLVGIIMTGAGTIASAVEAMQTGALDYIQKPFKLSVILPVLSRALLVRQLRIEKLALEESLRERTAQLEAANGELESFSYSVSHDLRAPLRHIAGFVDILRQDAGPSLSAEHGGHLATIAQAAKRMDDLITDLLAFSRIAHSTIRQEEVNFDQLARETVGELQAETKARNLVWEIHALPMLRADRALLRLVLVNLLSNAVKFTGARAAAKIEIGSRPGENGETVIFIRDNGAGFDPEYAHKLFGVFQRLHRQDQFEGTGIGLANVKRIIHRHGGRVWAEGAVDAGATFYFSIPN